MNHWAYIPRSELQRLFPIVICLDEALEIVYASEKLHQYLPEVAHNPRLDEVFQVLRPGNFSTFADALQSLDSLCLMTAHNGQFAIRGQLLRTRYGDEQVLCLCGAPWLFWMSSNCPEVRLGLSDFSPSDVQLDQLFFMSTERQMVADLESLNTELTDAKHELEQTHEAQHRFFAKMSHEMRTPLNGVVSALSLLEANPLDSRQEQLLGLAKGASRNLMEVINYVLDLSKLDLAGEDQDNDFNLPELIRSTLDILDAKAREKSLELTLELSPDIPVCCSGNPSLIRQVILNLVMNAIKFTDSGSVKVQLQRVGGEGAGCTLRFSVVDTGIGIPSELQRHIFEPFYSTHQFGGKHPDAGTGLGLDIVRRNVEHMGGKICVLSEPGVGSTFWFDWPTTEVAVVTYAKAENGKSAEASTPNDETMELSGKILLVDDNQTNLLLGSMIMESMGLKVVTAEGGLEAVAAALHQDFDLVLMDINMPDIDGIEATRRIRDYKDIHELPIVALTALAYDKEKSDYLDKGMSGYLTKPIVREALASELAQWLNSEQQALSQYIAPDNAGDGQHGEYADLLDHAILEQMDRQIGRNNLVTVLTKVLAEAGQRWDELVAADKADDRVATQRHVHSLASIFRSVGLMPAAEALGEVEALLRAGDDVQPGWLGYLAELKTESLDGLAQILRRYAAAN